MPHCKAFAALPAEQQEAICFDIIETIETTYGDRFHVPDFKESMFADSSVIEVLEFTHRQKDGRIKLRCNVKYGIDQYQIYGCTPVEGESLYPYYAEYEVSFKPVAKDQISRYNSAKKIVIINDSEHKSLACSAKQLTKPIPTDEKIPVIDWGIYVGGKIKTFLANFNGLANFYYHSDVEKIWLEDCPSRHKYITPIICLPRANLNYSGRSGAFTFIIKLEDGYEWNRPEIPVKRIREKWYVISVGNTPKQRKMMLHASTMQQKLYDEGIPVPRIRKPLTDYYNTGQFYCIQECIHGRHFNPTVAQVENLGKALGEIANLPANEAPETGINTVVPTDIYFQDIKAAMEWARDHDDYWSRMVRSSTRQLESRFGKKTGIPIFPEGWVHGDIHGKNVIFGYKKNDYYGKASSKAVLLDFQRTGKGAYVNDIVLAMYFFCTGDDGKLNPEFTKAFFKGYCAARTRNDPETGNIPLTKIEVASLAEMLAEMAHYEDLMTWVMFKGNTAKFENFAIRNKELPAQMNEYKHAHVKFTKEFLDMDYHKDLMNFSPLELTHTKRLAQQNTKNTGRELVHS